MSDLRPVFFFDIDNCLYSSSRFATFRGKEQFLNDTQDRKVREVTTGLVTEYIKNTLSLDQEAAYKLHIKYHNEYSLIVEGLARNHSISPLHFNSHVDDALPLEDLLKPDPELREMLQDIDKSKVKLWLLTNAYVNHGRRVVRLLEIEDQFEGLTYCDYEANPIRSKPHLDMFKRAMKEACVEDMKSCYFVDDSAESCFQAEKLGWTTVHLLEENIQPPEGYVCKYQISHLSELRELFPQFYIEHKTDSFQ